MSDAEEFGTLTFHRDSDDQICLVGDAPPVIGISEQYLTFGSPKFVRVSGSEVYIQVDPPLHYRIIGASVVQPGVWIAEKIT